MIKQIFIPVCVLAGTAAAVLYFIHPYNGRRKTTLSLFGNQFIAHRGLFKDPETPENSLAAFKKAVDAGYGIELDVQLTKDRKTVVFHDDTLLRMCSDPRLLRDLKYSRIKKFRLAGTGEQIPDFKDVLKLVNGQVPLVVEIKPEGHFLIAAKQVADALDSYRGVYCIESFNPIVLFWFRCHRPEILRGQLSTVFQKDVCKYPRAVQFILTNMLLNFLSKPDFISYNHMYANRPAFRICTRFFRSVNAAWTLKSKKELDAAKKHFHFFIFDSFLPD